MRRPWLRRPGVGCWTVDFYSHVQHYSDWRHRFVCKYTTVVCSASGVVSCVAVSVSALKSSTWSERRRNCAHHFRQLSCRATIALRAILARNIYISGNGKECPPQVTYLLIYFTCDLNKASLSRSRHWWAATASAACVANWWRSWPMANTLTCLCSCQR